jgi:hypothetical protein
MRTLLYWLKAPSVWIPLLTFVVLVFHPLPICIDCEGDHPWGVSYTASPNDYVFFEIWFLALSFAAGFFRLRSMLLMPVGLTLAYLATQHFGGVTWWSLRVNEGPVILIAGLFFGCGALVLGLAIHLIIQLLRHRDSSKEKAALP